MSYFKNEKISIISSWFKPDDCIKKQFIEICNDKILLGNFVYQIEKIYKDKKICKRLQINRLICGIDIIKEDIIINKDIL